MNFPSVFPFLLFLGDPHKLFQLLKSPVIKDGVLFPSNFE